jgi:toxin ParE1/3/4
MKLRYGARARSQLVAIHAYVTREAGSAAASRAGSAIREAAELLRHFPGAGRLGKVAGTREWVVRGLPYVIVYEIYQGDPSEVMILGIFRARQNR